MVEHIGVDTNIDLYPEMGELLGRWIISQKAIEKTLAMNVGRFWSTCVGVFGVVLNCHLGKQPDQE